MKANERNLKLVAVVAATSAVKCKWLHCRPRPDRPADQRKRRVVEADQQMLLPKSILNRDEGPAAIS